MIIIIFLAIFTCYSQITEKVSIKIEESINIPVGKIEMEWPFQWITTTKTYEDSTGNYVVRYHYYTSDYDYIDWQFDYYADIDVFKSGNQIYHSIFGHYTEKDSEDDTPSIWVQKAIEGQYRTDNFKKP